MGSDYVGCATPFPPQTVLFAASYPNWAFTLVAGTTLWGVRVYAYLLGLTDRYPPFAMS